MTELPDKIIIVNKPDLLSEIHQMTGFRPRKEPEQVWSGLCSNFPIWVCIEQNIKSVFMDLRGYNRGEIVIHKHDTHCVLFKDEEVIVLFILDDTVKPAKLKQLEQKYCALGVEFVQYGKNEVTEQAS